MDIKFGKKTFIRNIGKDEYWLQDLIYDDPSIIGLGTLQPVNKEKKQSSGGRLDILLKDPQDNTMYEIEVMLGETDPSHIIRSIEYWDNEKRKYPQRQHFAVLIAESFDRRYFNIVQIGSHPRCRHATSARPASRRPGRRATCFARARPSGSTTPCKIRSTKTRSRLWG